jgi:hypothetical protein
MKGRSITTAAFSLIALLGFALAQADPLLDEVVLVADSAVASTPIPGAWTFSVTQSGSYSVTLTDLGVPATLSSLSMALVSSTQSLADFTGADVKTVDLLSGVTYTVQPLAVASAMGGSFTVQVAPAAGGGDVAQNAWTVSATAATVPVGQSNLQTEFMVATAGTYQLTVTDQAFPAALSSLSLAIFPHNGVTAVPPTPLSGPNQSVQLSLQPGAYDLFVVATANASTEAGFYTINIAPSGAGSPVYTAAIPVGSLPAPINVNIPTSGTVTFQLTDLATPAALGSISALVSDGSSVPLQVSGAGSYSFSGQSPQAQLYVLATPNAAAGEGAFEAYMSEGGTTLLDVAQPVLASGNYGYGFAAKLSSSGTYQLNIEDFQVPTGLGGMTALVVQRGAVLTTNPNGGSFVAAAGPLGVLAFPTLDTPTANSLFGVQITQNGLASPVFQATQGVGALFSARTITVGQSGNYGLTLTDLGFPAPFGQVAVVITQGNTREGYVVNSGGDSAQLALGSLSPGTYVLNVLASVNSAAHYGLYGLDVSPVPTITLNSSADTVISGQQATLTWTTTDASSCVASGGWSGALATSGSQMTGALTATTTFTLTCAGPGGSAAESTQIAVTSAKSASGGGGTISPVTLMVLLLTMAFRERRRFSAALYWLQQRKLLY